jgi:ADP-ribose pyrophosphatase YjhB (NUDIX family)
MADPGRVAQPLGAAWLRLYRAFAWTTQPKYTIGAMAYIERTTGEVLLVRQRLRSPSRWGLPGGFKRPHEPAAAAAAREVREETGLAVRVGEADFVAQYEQPWARHLDTLFAICVDDPGRPVQRISLEIAEVGWFPLGSLPPLTREAALALEHLGSKRRAEPAPPTLVLDPQLPASQLPASPLPAPQLPERPAAQ